VTCRCHVRVNRHVTYDEPPDLTHVEIVRCKECRDARKLRRKVQALIADLERSYEPGLDQPTAKGMAQRLRRELLGSQE
jgi:hypothetical protein